MDKSLVYFTNLRANSSINLLQKFKKLITKAGINEIDFTNRMTAIKIHFGEPGNLAYIRPNYARVLADLIRDLNGKPFLTDTNTLYSGQRANAIDHFSAAEQNGFNSTVTNCPIIIADGLKGNDTTYIDINQDFIVTAKIGSVIADADIIISMNHFKGHELTGFGGALKNIGMGCASVEGKKEQHSSSHPKIVEENCTSCNRCVINCAHKAIHLNTTHVAEINHDLCIGCGQCIAVCQDNAAQVVWDASSEILNKKMAEYSLAVLKGKPSFHINFILNVSPDCDCWGYNDYPMVPDIGIAASFDPVALDMASANLVKEAPILLNSRISKNLNADHGCTHDKFKMAHPNTSWDVGLEHAEKIRIGVRDYKLVEIN